MPMSALGHPDGANLKELRRFRIQNVTGGLPAATNYNASNAGLVLYDDDNDRIGLLYETGTANVMAWAQLATDADVAAGFSGVVIDNTGNNIILSGNGVAGTELQAAVAALGITTAELADGSVTLVKLDNGIGLDDLDGTRIAGPLDVNGQVVGNGADGVAATDFVTLQQLQAAVAATAITGQYVGSSATFAGLPAAATNNGDWSILSADDVGNQSGIYVSNGATWSLAKEIPEAFTVSNATELVAGIAQIATTAQVAAGTDDTTIVTPLKLAQELATFNAVGRDAQNLTGAAANTASTITHGLASDQLLQVWPPAHRRPVRHRRRPPRQLGHGRPAPRLHRHGGRQDDQHDRPGNRRPRPSRQRLRDHHLGPPVTVELLGPDGGLRAQLRRWRSWVVATAPAPAVYNADNEALTAWDQSASREIHLRDTGGGTMAWRSVAYTDDLTATPPTVNVATNVTAGDFVAMTATGLIPATSAGPTPEPAIGFVRDTVTAGNPAALYDRGLILTGLTAGAHYFLGANGAVTTTAPTAAGDVEQYLGVATPAGELWALIQLAIEIV